MSIDPHFEALPANDDPAFVAFAVQALSEAEIADGLTHTQLAQLASIGQVRQYGGNALICREHERSDELYIIETGSVEVWLDPQRAGVDTQAMRQIATIQPSETCGELALLDGGVRSAQLRAGPRGVRMMAFTRDALLALCESDTAIGYRLMRNIAAALALRLCVQDMRLYSAE